MKYIDMNCQKVLVFLLFQGHFFFTPILADSKPAEVEAIFSGLSVLNSNTETENTSKHDFQTNGYLNLKKKQKQSEYHLSIHLIDSHKTKYEDTSKKSQYSFVEWAYAYIKPTTQFEYKVGILKSNINTQNSENIYNRNFVRKSLANQNIFDNQDLIGSGIELNYLFHLDFYADITYQAIEYLPDNKLKNKNSFLLHTLSMSQYIPINEIIDFSSVFTIGKGKNEHNSVNNSLHTRLEFTYQGTKNTGAKTYISFFSFEQRNSPTYELSGSYILGLEYMPIKNLALGLNRESFGLQAKKFDQTTKTSISINNTNHIGNFLIQYDRLKNKSVKKNTEVLFVELRINLALQ